MYTKIFGVAVGALLSVATVASANGDDMTKFTVRVENITQSDAFTYTVVNEAGKTASARVLLRITPQGGEPANVLRITREANGIRIVFAGVIGRSYRLEFSPSMRASLSPQGWTTVYSTTVGPSGYVEFLAPLTGTGGFFRTATP